MGRNWRPKYQCHCTNCGWKGKRAAITNPCPKCGKRTVTKTVTTQK